MRSRPLSVTVAAILLALLSLTDFPFVWWLLFPGEEEPPEFVLYSGILIGVAGFIVAYGLWILEPWSFWYANIVCVLNFLLGAPAVVLPMSAFH